MKTLDEKIFFTAFIITLVVIFLASLAIVARVENLSSNVVNHCVRTITVIR